MDTTGLPQQGDVIDGRYQVEEFLGSGGMGVVVAARHLALRQRVAVKLLFPGSAKLPGTTERFLREARLAASIQSEHVTRVLDVGALESGAPYMVMEYLSGTDLSLVIEARGPLPVQQAVDFILQVGEAIAEAHSIGIIHRDLKTHNLFLTIRPDGSPRLKVLDFGLSKTTQSDPDYTTEATLTATDVVAGSPVYMSPEQLRGLALADARSDIWALGVILYEMLSGHRPFGGTSLTALSASIAADTPVPVSALRKGIPGGLNAWVMRCLEKDPARRVQSVAELARGIAPFASSRASNSVERIANMAPAPPAGGAPKPAAPGAPRDRDCRAPSAEGGRGDGHGAPSAPAPKSMEEDTFPSLPGPSSLFYSNQTSPRLATLLPSACTSVPPFSASLPVSSRAALQGPSPAPAPVSPPAIAAPVVTRSAAALVAGSAAASLLLAIGVASIVRLATRSNEQEADPPAAYAPAIAMTASPTAPTAPVAGPIAAPIAPTTAATSRLTASTPAIPGASTASRPAIPGAPTASRPAIPGVSTASRPAIPGAPTGSVQPRSAPMPRRVVPPPSQWPSAKVRAAAGRKPSDPLDKWD
jgi:serine/threonine-protein kinase